MNYRTPSWRRQRALKRRTESAEPHERWMISYADLVTLLFTLFVVLYAATDHERASQVAQAVAAAVINQPLPPQDGRGVLPGGKTVSEARTEMDREFAANHTLRARARIVGKKDGFTV